ncbi:MAG: zf-TFIIB domain-containing protein [Candidatus Dormibacteraceae bacterium]
MDNSLPQLRCPRCRVNMVLVRRTGINVDECQGCGGMFLDRGELELLMAAEDGHYAEQFGGAYPEPDRHHRKVYHKRGGFFRALLGDRK